MKWAIIKCDRCGRVIFYPYCAHKRANCNDKCNNKIWIDNDSMLDIRYGTDFQPVENTAYIFINVFNNYAYLAARVYSQDGKNFMVLPIPERSIVGLSRQDTLLAIPAELKHTTSWDGLIIESGCYPVSQEMEQKLKSNHYVSKRE